MSDVTRILSQIESGDQKASEELLPLVYDELRILASGRMAHERPDHTLQATALVHEAYVRMVDVDHAQHWDSRGHFFAAAAEAMRRILVDQAREKASLKRGGHLEKVDLADSIAGSLGTLTPDELLEFDDTLAKLHGEDAEVADLVRLRVYAGLSVTEAAQAQGISRSLAYKHWDYALSWFQVEAGV